MPEQERRHRVEGERDPGDRVIGRRPSPGRRDHAGADAHHQPQHRAAEGERGGDRKVARYDRGHPLLREKRFPQIAAGQSSQEREVLDAHGLVKPQARAHDLNRLLARLTAGDEPRHVARHGEVDDEHGGGDHPDHERAPRETTKEEADHAASSGLPREAVSRRGSSASRTLSPSTLNATVVMSSAAPGKNTNHHATL